MPTHRIYIICNYNNKEEKRKKIDRQILTNANREKRHI